jgi:hypothetical protein
MFNLEQSIADWRRRMLAVDIKSPVPLEELENHLREEFETQIRAGVAPARAFEIAARRLGSPAAVQQEFGKVGKVMPAWARKLYYTACAVVTVPCCAVGLILLSNIHHSHAARGEGISLAGAILSEGLLLSSWMFLWRFLPVLLPKTRIGAELVCIVLSGPCVSILLRLLLLGAGTREEFAIAVAWAIIPMWVACAFIFGLEEAAYRKTAMSDM